MYRACFNLHLRNRCNNSGRGYRILEKGVQDTDRPMWSPVGSSGGILSRKIFKIEVLGNGISGILRPSKRVIMSILFNLGGSIKPPLVNPP